MKTWEEIDYSNTFGEAVDKLNRNSESTEFLDKTTGTILCNSVMFSGKETIDNELVLPFKNIKSSGTVSSDTIFDNFVLYFRNENKVLELNNFPIDLLAFADGKLHFLFIKSDYTYRVSDTIFGRTDELLLGRFIITTNSNWSQFYIMSQGTGTPMYDGADEFYETDGLIIKSPSDLHLSFTGGTIKRSGINYTNYKSPNTVEYENLYEEGTNIPIRYVNNYNEIDYSLATTDSIITNRYMIYNNKAKLKAKSEILIDKILSLCYKLEDKTNFYADELSRAVDLGVDTDNDFKNRIIIDALKDYYTIFNEHLVRLKALLDEQELSSIDSRDITTIKTNITNYINTNLYNIEDISSAQVEYLRKLYSFIENRDETVCDKPLYTILGTLSNDLDNLTIEAGTISTVLDGKYTIQRILYDVYTNCFILQYGDTVYDTYDDVIAATELQEYPAPWNKTVYIPMAIIILKAGITSINDDEETLILSKRGVNVDEPQEGFADFAARLKIRHLEESMTDLSDSLHDDMDDLETSINNTITDLKNNDIGNYLKTSAISLEPYTLSFNITNGMISGKGGWNLDSGNKSKSNYYPLSVCIRNTNFTYAGGNGFNGPFRINYVGFSVQQIGTCNIRINLSFNGSSSLEQGNFEVYVVWIKVKS